MTLSMQHMHTASPVQSHTVLLYHFVSNFHCHCLWLFPTWGRLQTPVTNSPPYTAWPGWGTSTVSRSTCCPLQIRCQVLTVSSSWSHRGVTWLFRLSALHKCCQCLETLIFKQGRKFCCSTWVLDSWSYPYFTKDVYKTSWYDRPERYIWMRHKRTSPLRIYMLWFPSAYRISGLRNSGLNSPCTTHTSKASNGKLSPRVFQTRQCQSSFPPRQRDLERSCDTHEQSSKRWI